MDDTKIFHGRLLKIALTDQIPIALRQLWQAPEHSDQQKAANRQNSENLVLERLAMLQNEIQSVREELTQLNVTGSKPAVQTVRDVLTAEEISLLLTPNEDVAADDNNSTDDEQQWLAREQPATEIGEIAGRSSQPNNAIDPGEILMEQNECQLLNFDNSSSPWNND